MENFNSEELKREIKELYVEQLGSTEEVLRLLEEVYKEFEEQFGCINDDDEEI